MSCYVISYQDGHKVARPVETEAEYRALRGSEKQCRMVDACRKGNAEAKRRLLQMNYSCIPDPPLTPPQGRGIDTYGILKGSKTPSNSVGMDIDFDPADPAYEQKMSEAPQMILAKKDEVGLLMLERSVRKGYHIAFKRRPELSQEENLRWASDLLGVKYDEGAKDVTRVFFTTTAEPEDLIYLNKALFERTLPLTQPHPLDPPNSGGRNPQGRGVNSDATPEIGEEEETLENVTASDNREVTTPLPCGGAGGGSACFENIPYRNIVEALEDQLGGIPAHGSRNQFIFSMACQLRYICNDDPEWIAQVLPTYGEAREKQMSTIRSACNRSQNKAMPKLLLRAIDVARAVVADAEAGESGENCPPPMPKKLPPLIKLLISKTPKIYQPAVAHAVFPALATHLWKTRFRYIDNVEHEATLMNVLMAGTGAGKNCIVAPINCILKDIRERDAISLEKERMWKEEMNTKGANKDKKKRPEGIVVQEVDADMTNAAFVLRLAEAEEHFLYVRMNEIDQFDALKTSGRSKSQFQIMCLAFDPGNTYGQTRVGTQSISARVCIRFNWNASTTIRKGQQYFQSVLTDGPISRINFCTIPEQPIGSDTPIYGSYDADFDSQLRPYIDRLNAARGVIECPQAFRFAKELDKENKRFAELSRSRTFENLSFRANVIAFLKAMVLYVAQGEQWDKTIEDFIRWSEQYDLWCKMQFFGDAIDEANGTNQRHKRGPKNLLDLLPERFTAEEAIAVRRQNGLDAEHTASMLANWKSRGYIGDDPEGQKNVYVKALQKKNTD